MNTNETISGIGVVPVIKLNHPERDAAPLAHALCAGGCRWRRSPSGPPGPPPPSS